MSTTQQDKPSAKARQRARKAEQRGGKRERQVSNRSDRVDQADQNQMADVAARTEVALAAEMPAVSDLAEDVVAQDVLSGEVLLPEDKSQGSAQPVDTIGLHTVVQAYADYARKSWSAGRSLVERLMITHSLEEAAEVQGDFAKQAYANFVVHSQKICELYAEFSRQFFRPWENFVTEWTRIGR